MRVELIPIDAIKIDHTRFRQDNGDLEKLASSLLTFGQLEPIIVDQNIELIAGFRRYSAARLNGWTQIAAVLRTEIDELHAREIELEENIARKQMTWQEEQIAIAELDRIKKAKDPNWTQGLTAQAAGGNTSQRDVSEAVTLAKAMEVFPELKDAKSKNQAMSWLKAKAANVTRVLDVKDKKIDFNGIEEKIILGDSRQVIKQVPDESFDLVLTDPPFGIDYDDRKSGTDGSLTAYEDTEELYLSLLAMAPELYRVVKPNGWLVWFLGISWYERAKVAFRDAGFAVDEIPIIWDRSGGRCHTNRPDRFFARAYDIALHCRKGDPQIIQRGTKNIIKVDPVENSERQALVERPVGLYQELIKRLTVEGETVADFFVGSGSCPAAAASLRRDYFGVEQNPERRAIALNKIKAHTPEPK